MTMGAPITVPRRTLTVDEYHKMGEAGLLGEDDHVELIGGNSSSWHLLVATTCNWSTRLPGCSTVNSEKME